jgi:two-component system chemotaxis sensor kinase CheA
MSTVDAEQDEMREIINDFLVEAEELVDSLDNNLVALEERPNDLDLLNEIFRAAHTIKGTSGFLGLDKIMSLTHNMEDVLNKLRKEELRVTSDIMDVVLESVDMLKILLEDVSHGRESDLDIEGVGAKLIAVVEGGSSSDVPAEEAKPAKPKEPPAETALKDVGPEKAKTATAKKETAQKGIDQTIRVDVDRLDSLMNLMGELVLGRNTLMQTSNRFVKKHEDLDGIDDLTRAGAQINFITTEIQTAVMKMRMLPIGKVFSKFPRMVRDLAREKNKKINLDIYGEETELDKSVIEEIGDPLVHLIRNSCDHGIESPEERVAAGKPETGTIRLGAAQEGSSIVVNIEDDGKGMDVEAIKKKAVERGLITKEAAEKLSNQEAFRFIFRPGFSTAKKVTNVSGRGVGMDVVKTNIEKLKGIIDIESTFGVGSRISVKLPLTLAIIQGLLVISQGELYIIPLGSVLEMIRISREDIDSVNRHDVITLRGGVLPLVGLNHILRGDRGGSCENEKPYVVVVGLAEKRLGLIVDELLGQEEVVIKSMGEMLGVTKGVAGATILGDGRVRLIVDLIGLFELAGG